MSFYVRILIIQLNNQKQVLCKFTYVTKINGDTFKLLRWDHFTRKQLLCNRPIHFLKDERQTGDKQKIHLKYLISW